MQTYYGPGDPRNYDATRYAQYLATFNALDATAPLGAYLGGAPLTNSTFFASNLLHWLQASGSAISLPSTDSVSQELALDPKVLDYFTGTSGKWFAAVRAFVLGHAAVMACQGTATDLGTGSISVEAPNGGIGLAFSVFDGVYGVGKPYKAISNNASFAITINEDGSITYDGSGDVTLYKNWGWTYPNEGDPYSHWPSSDLNFKAWYIEHYGGAKTFPLIIDLGNIDWSGTLPAPPAAPCRSADQAPPAQYSPVQLTPGAASSVAVAISRNGHYVDGDYGFFSGTSWRIANGSAPQPLSLRIYHNSVNDSGTVVGSTSSGGSSGQVATESAGGAVTYLPTVTDSNSPAGVFPDDAGSGLQIDNNGDVSGTSDCPPTGPQTQPCTHSYHAFYLPSGASQATDIGPLDTVDANASGLATTVNDNGQVAGAMTQLTGGNSGTASETIDYRWTPTTGASQIGPAPYPGSGAIPNVASSNDLNTLVGNGLLSSGGSDDGFVSLNAGAYVDLGGLAPIYDSQYCGTGQADGGSYTISAANDVNNGGVIVGSSSVAGGPFYYSCGTSHATIWPTGGGSPVDLNGLIPQGSGWLLSDATGIDDFGDIVGYGTYNNSTQAFMLVPSDETLSGTVVSADGTVPSGLTVVVTGPSGQVAAAGVDSSGHYSTFVPPGNYTISLTGAPAGYTSPDGSRPLTVLNQGAEADFELVPPPPACDTSGPCDSGGLPEVDAAGPGTAPPAPAGTSNANSANSSTTTSTATATSGQTSATVTGASGVTTADYATNPTAVDPGLTNPVFFDVSIGAGATDVEVSECGLPSQDNTLMWWDGIFWYQILGTTSSNGCLSTDVTDITSPALHSLYGTPFVAGQLTGAPPTPPIEGAATPQTVTITSTPPTNPTVGGTYALTATGGGSGNPIVFSIDTSSTTGACTVSGSTVSFTGVGTCVIDANQAGNTTYAAGSTQQTVVVGQASQTVTITSTPPASPTVGGTYALTATGGGSGNPIVFSIDTSSTTGACTVSGSTVSFTGVGTCVIDANQAGNANYKAGFVQQTLTISAPSSKPTFSADTPPTTATIGALYFYVFSANSTTPVTYGLVGAPPWLVINPTYGILIGLPPPWIKSFSFSVRASNSNGTTTAGPFTVTVNPLPPASQRADLSASLNCPSLVKIHTVTTCSVTVTNHGPAPASGVKAALVFSRSFTSLTPVGGAKFGNLIIWNAGSLASGKSVSFTAAATASTLGTTGMVGGSWSQAADTNPLNNLAVRFVQVTT